MKEELDKLVEIINSLEDKASKSDYFEEIEMLESLKEKLEFLMSVYSW